MIALILKVTVLLGAGFVATALLRSRSAALRHVVWTATLIGALALAAAASMLPALEIPLPGVVAQAIAPIPATEPLIGSEDAPLPAAASSVTGPLVERDRPGRGLTAASAFAALWLLGAVLVLGWCLLGHARLASLVSRARPVTSDDWRSLLAELASASGARRSIELLFSREVGSPVLWELHRAVILLPGDADGWSMDRRRAVIAHELAHVVRHDGIINAMACAAAALYWFHPLVWIAMRRLRIESERACDDRVLAHGTSAADYAGHLLQVARSARALRLVGITAIGMARPSELEGRLLAVLDDDCSRGDASVRARILLAVALMLGVPLLAAARIVPLTPVESTLNVATATTSSDSSIERTLDAAEGERLTLDLETGASVDLRGWDEPRVRIRMRLSGINRADTRVDIARVADGVRVHSWIEATGRTQSTSHSLEIMVPRHYDLDLESAGGDLSLADLDGRFVGMTGGGSLTISHVSGEADLQTGGGDIRVSDADLRGSVSTGGGSVVFSNVSSALHGSSGSGPVIYHDAAEKGSDKDAAGRLHVERAGGDIALDEVTDGADLETGGGDISVGRAHGYITASTGGGNIDITHVDGGVRAGTGAGKIRISVDDLDRDGHGVSVGTGHGDVVIELPADVAATFDLETAYTDNHRGKTRIDADWQLDRTETDTWDDRAGTPRKYVRARGDVGGGGPLIMVRVVNGDIIVRRTGTGS